MNKAPRGQSTNEKMSYRQLACKFCVLCRSMAPLPRPIGLILSSLVLHIGLLQGPVLDEFKMMLPVAIFTSYFVETLLLSL
jgi:hypothetical protein